MNKINRDSVMTLEAYAKIRQKFRAQVMTHKKSRKIYLGSNILLIFEDELTVRYQIQEMLRVEKMFEEKEILEEINVCNLLIPDGSNLKATMMIEYPDPKERAVRLVKLVGVENKVWLRIAEHESVYAIADEDLGREREEKTSAVHFLRFEFTREMIQALRNGANMSIGIDHPSYPALISTVDAAIRNSIINDFTV